MPLIIAVAALLYVTATAIFLFWRPRSVDDKTERVQLRDPTPLEMEEFRKTGVLQSPATTRTAAPLRKG